MLGCDAALVDYRNLTEIQLKELPKTIEAVVARAHLSDMVRERVQETIARFQGAGWSLQTCNHYAGAAKTFAKWCDSSDRTREDLLRGLKTYNATEDRRHLRRSISVDELKRLLEATRQGPVVLDMTGPERALCYWLASQTGLRHNELRSIRPESFDWAARTVSVAAAYSKNRQAATLPIPTDLAPILADYVKSLAPGAPVFRLREGRGADMLKVDLAAAGIPYRDASGHVFDFHSLRVELATLADQAGVSPRVVQRLMRHSSLDLTNRYTRPRAVDIEAAATMLPSLKPDADSSEPVTLAATGTDPAPTADPRATQKRYPDGDAGRNRPIIKGVVSNEERMPSPPFARLQLDLGLARNREFRDAAGLPPGAPSRSPNGGTAPKKARPANSRASMASRAGDAVPKDDLLTATSREILV
jgi:integrase